MQYSNDTNSVWQNAIKYNMLRFKKLQSPLGGRSFLFSSNDITHFP